MGLGYDLWEIEDIQLAVGKDLSARAVDHEHLVIHWTQKLHGLVDQGRVFSQE